MRFKSNVYSVQCWDKSNVLELKLLCEYLPAGMRWMVRSQDHALVDGYNKKLKGQQGWGYRYHKEIHQLTFEETMSFEAFLKFSMGLCEVLSSSVRDTLLINALRSMREEIDTQIARQIERLSLQTRCYSTEAMRVILEFEAATCTSQLMVQLSSAQHQSAIEQLLRKEWLHSDRQMTSQAAGTLQYLISRPGMPDRLFTRVQYANQSAGLPFATLLQYMWQEMHGKIYGLMMKIVPSSQPIDTQISWEITKNGISSAQAAFM